MIVTNISYDRKRQANRWECINLLLQQSRITRSTVFNSISVAPLYCCVPIWHTYSTKKLTIKRQPWTLFLQARSKNSLGTKIHRTTSLIKKTTIILKQQEDSGHPLFNHLPGPNEQTNSANAKMDLDFFPGKPTATHAERGIWYQRLWLS